jgi:DHA2 family multidrug resistance protein-like MFS transporter
MSNKNESTIGAKSPSKARRKDWIGLVVIALPCMLYSMDLTVLNLALPHLSADLKPSSSELLWIVDIYGFMVAGFLIIMGTLGDRIGRRKLLMIGAFAFGISSLLAAYSETAVMLIVARAILGVAGATLAPSTLSLIRNMFHDDKQRTFAIGIWITSYSVGAAIGPLIGGTLLEHFWWGSVFLIAIPVMILLLVLGPILLPEYKNNSHTRLDFLSAFLSLAAVLPVIFGLKKIAENGPGLFSALYILLGILLGIFFYERQKKLAEPLLDLKLFRVPSFSASLLVYTLATFVAFGIFIFTFQFLELIVGLTPLKAGLWSLPLFIAFIIGSMISPILVKRLHPSQLISAGLFLAVIGFSLITQVHRDSGLIFLVTGSFLYCLGLAPVFTLATDTIVGSAPPEKAGAASALSETGSEFGGALGIALLGSLGTLIYRTRLTNLMPDGLSTEMGEAATETLGSAVSQAAQLQGPLNNLLLTSANAAFTSGMQAAAGVCAILALCLAFLSQIWLRPKKVKVEVENVHSIKFSCLEEQSK